jgi:hypothetical protein
MAKVISRTWFEATLNDDEVEILRSYFNDVLKVERNDEYKNVYVIWYDSNHARPDQIILDLNKMMDIEKLEKAKELKE